MSEEAQKALHWLTVGFISDGARKWVKDVGGQVRELSDDPKLIAVGLAYDPAGTWVWSRGEQQFKRGIEFWSSGEIQEASTSINLLYASTKGTPAEYASAETCYLCLPDEEYDEATGNVKGPGQYETPSTLPPFDELDLDNQPF
ncbi:MAG: hypothetical protein J2P37_00335 [Ktedonobacteraceae bacterium]|nr:hypothetical protein [Ktedonobacteraceae bacterium]